MKSTGFIWEGSSKAATKKPRLFVERAKRDRSGSK